MNLKFETIVKIFRKIMQLNAVIILKSTNEYNRKIVSKSGRKMDLYPALDHFIYVHISLREKIITTVLKAGADTSCGQVFASN